MTPSESTEIILRLDANARALDDVRAIAEEGLEQGKLTNGRVSMLERKGEIAAALAKQRAEMEASHRRKWEFVRPASAAALSGAVLLIGQHFLG